MKSNAYDIVIKDTRILTDQYEIKNHVNIAIKDGRISCISNSSAAQDWGSSREALDGSDLLWMPGLTDGHMHTCQQLLRGRILDELPMIWTRIMLPFESALTSEAVSLSAGLAALEMIKSGTTSFIDAGGIHMDEAVHIYIKSGMRGALTLSTMDDPKVPEPMRAKASVAVSNSDRFYDTWNGAGDGRIQVYYSLRSLLSCSQDLITGIFGAAADKDAMVEAHMNEYPNEVNSHLERFGLRPMEYLERLGVLSHRFLSAHSILLSEHEIELMKQYKIKAVHCPFSNCGKGVPNTPRLLESGVPVGLGTDGAAHGGLNLFHEMKIFRSVMNAQYGVPTANPVIMPAKTILSMALSGGGAALGMEESLGKIKEGCHADLIAIDLDKPHIFPTGNLVHTLLESVGSGDVIHSIIDGKLVMKNRVIQTLDEEKIRYDIHNFMTKNLKTEDELCYL